MPKYCPTCNRSSADCHFYGDFCEFCARDRFGLKLDEAIEITRCKKCGKIRVVGDFVLPTEQNIEDAVKRRFSKYALTLLRVERSGNVVVELIDERNRSQVKIEKEIKVDYKKTLCESCYKRLSDYYEAVVQVRGNEQRGIRIMKKIKEYFERRGEFISKVKRVDNGYDVFVSNKRMASQFMSFMKLHPVVSYTLTGVKNGKKIYKNTYAIHYRDLDQQEY